MRTRFYSALLALLAGFCLHLRGAISDGLIGYWTFDQTNGVVAIDSTTNGNHGALNGFPIDNSQWVSGRIGGALNFRGAVNGDYVRVPNYPKPTSAMSVSMWAWAEARPVWATLVKNWGAGQAGQFHFGLQDAAGDLSNFIRVQSGATPNARENTPLPLGSWQHVAFTADGTTLRLYRNGLLVGTAAYTGVLAAPPMAALGIGVKLNDAGTAPDAGSPGYWQGRMDDLGLWNRVLSEAEILAVYGGGLDGQSLTNADAPAVGGGGVAITEFMASNTGALRDEDGETPDWIEIYNGTAAAVNLGGWALTDTTNDLRRWIFPSTNLAANSYLVVFASGKNRTIAGAPLHTDFSLDAGGEYLALVDPRTNIISQFAPAPQVANVSYGVARLAPPQAFITNGSPLHFVVPTDGTLGTNWIAPGFDDSDWNTGANPVGYETAPEDYAGLYRTDVRALMFNLASSCYIRLPFVVTNPAAFTDWTLRLQADDGVVIWINGQEVLRYFVPDMVAWNSFSTTNRVDSDVLVGEIFNLAEFENLIVPGTNIMAIHALNARLDSSDLLINPLLDAKSTAQLAASLRYFTTPTPGTANLGGIEVLGPIITELRHFPEVPLASQELLVTARVAPALTIVSNVTLRYRVMYSNEVALPMLDDGQHGDGDAGDGVFGATIPAALPGQMVRYYVRALDHSGSAGRAPLFLDPLGSPEYQGTMIPNPAVSSPLPVFHWFVQNPLAAEAATGTRSSLFYDGEFYDNIFVRLRGGTSRSWPKKSFKVEFNEGYHFRLRDSLPRVSEFDWNTTYTDKSYNRKILSYEGYRDAGHPVIEHFHAHLRQNGTFFSVTLWTEQPDRDFLRRWGFDAEGSFYKAGFNGGAGATYESVSAFEKKTRLSEGSADLQALISGLALSGPALENFLFDNVDVAAMVNFLAVVCVQQNIDACDKNHYLYRDTRGTREWRYFPWDLDLTYGPDALNTDAIVFNQQDTTTPHATSHPFIGARPYLLHSGKYNRFIEAMVNTPRTREMLLRRIRTLVDQQLVSGYYGRLIDQLLVLTATDVAADRGRWGASAHFGGTVYTHQQANDRIKNEYIAPRIGYLTGTTIVNVGTANPGPQLPFVNIRLGAIEVNPATGLQAQEYVALTNPNPFSVDLTGWRLRGDVEFELRPATVLLPGATLYLTPDMVEFRARPTAPRGGAGLFVQGNYRGNLSARGGSLRLLDQWGREADRVTLPPNPSPAQQFLRVTELMYHPAPLAGNTNGAEKFEFIELRNTAPSTTLDLTGVRFIDGIAFNFTGSSVTTLAPGAAVVLVGNPAAFTARYGSGIPVAGQYSGNLDNDGERVRLVDAAGEEILDFEYSDNWYPLTDGLGFSLVIVDPAAPFNTWGRKSSWRASGVLAGTPGSADPGPPNVAPIVINEVLARTDVPPPTDSIELFNPTSGNVNIGGWFLTDDFNTPRKFRIPDPRVIPGLGFAVFTETDFNPANAGFALGSDGDEAWLFSADAAGNLTGWVHGLRFGASDNGVSFGRVMTSVGEEHFVAQSNLTLNGSNSGPRVGPIVITEIHYHPPDRGTNDNGTDEFVEVQNISSGVVPLFDPGNPANTWRLRGGADFDWPPGQSLGPGQYALVVGFDPVSDPAAANLFRTRYGVDPSVPVLGPLRGDLDNSDDDVEIQKPTTPMGGQVPYVLVDKVSYGDEAPWAGADGDGASLQRRTASVYGNDPVNWAAAVPSPGRGYPGGTGPVITSQPLSQTVIAFQPATFVITASGTGPLRYQWRQNGLSLVGQTNATLTLANVQPQDYGAYDVIVLNAAGTAISSNATLSILVPPTITSQPRSQTILAGETATFTVVAVGTGPLTYQWRRNESEIPGATGTSLIFANAASADSGEIRVRVTDSIGFRDSTVAILTVLERPVITQQPTPAYQDVLQGGRLTIMTGATGTPPLSYRWRRNNVTIINQTNAILRITNASSANAGTYLVIVTNLAGSVTSLVATAVYQPDNDRDGISDSWERLYGLSTNSVDDAGSDLDGDGMSNLAEYIAGTIPVDPLSYLRLDAQLLDSSQVALRFLAVSNRTYRVLSRERIDTGLWISLSDITARSTNRMVILNDPAPATNRFYRLVVPAGGE
jgi:hypothetical protein